MSQQDYIWLNKHFDRYLLTCLWNAWTCFDTAHHSYSLPGRHKWYFQGHGFQGQCYENALFWQRNTNRQFAVEDL